MEVLPEVKLIFNKKSIFAIFLIAEILNLSFTNISFPSPVERLYPKDYNK